MMSYTEARNDAGILREYTVQRYQRVVTGDWTAGDLLGFNRMIRRIAHLTGKAESTVKVGLLRDMELAQA